MSVVCASYMSVNVPQSALREERFSPIGDTESSIRSVIDCNQSQNGLMTQYPSERDKERCISSGRAVAYGCK